VTSTGQYVIAWDFAKVRKGQMDKYEIKKYEDLVVQDNFRFGDDKEIVRPFHKPGDRPALIPLLF